MKIDNNLKKLRFDRGQISQQKLANAVFVTRLTIHSIENGKFVPSTYLSLKLAKFFNVKVEDIFFLKEEK